MPSTRRLTAMALGIYGVLLLIGAYHQSSSLGRLVLSSAFAATLIWLALRIEQGRPVPFLARRPALAPDEARRRAVDVAVCTVLLVGAIYAFTALRTADRLVLSMGEVEASYFHVRGRLASMGVVQGLILGTPLGAIAAAIDYCRHDL